MTAAVQSREIKRQGVHEKKSAKRNKLKIEARIERVGHRWLTLQWPIIFNAWGTNVKTDHHISGCAHCAKCHKKQSRHNSNYSGYPKPLQKMHHLLLAFIFTLWDTKRQKRDLRPSHHPFSYCANRTHLEKDCDRPWEVSNQIQFLFLVQHLKAWRRI